jgi:acyl-CoA reductase-like NAD-dependent aldehyde dehydrogenase
MQLYYAGQWRTTGRTFDVTNPFSGAVVDTIPLAGAAELETALQGLVEGARVMRSLTAHERSAILHKTAALMQEREEDFGRTISLEEGKILAEGRLEASRARETIIVSAEEAKRVCGEMVPLEGAPGVANRIGFTLRVPCGIVAAITPYNFPLNLVAHKVGPAIAAGNAVLIKPASDTPLSALKLVAALLDAGLPPSAIACLAGSGRELGGAIATDKRIRKISFTGSVEVGEQICRAAGIKRVTMELGSNSPVIVMDDADLDRAAELVTASGYGNAGQVCISAQRILVSRAVHSEFLERLVPRVRAITAGDQMDPAIKMGPMIREQDAQRVEACVGEAVSSGAKLLAGGQRTGTVHTATLLDQCRPEMRICRDELFGPALAVVSFDTLDEAIRLANDSSYGLAASIFTRDLNRAMRFAREVDSGNLHVNWGTQWRADLMPYGGLKDSGLGKEGPKHAIREMTEEKMVVLHLA